MQAAATTKAKGIITNEAHHDKTTKAFINEARFTNEALFINEAPFTNLINVIFYYH